MRLYNTFVILALLTIGFSDLSAQYISGIAINNDGDTLDIRVAQKSYSSYRDQIVYLDSLNTEIIALPSDYSIIKLIDGIENPLFKSFNNKFLQLLANGRITLLKDNGSSSDDRYLILKDSTEIVFPARVNNTEKNRSIGIFKYVVNDQIENISVQFERLFGSTGVINEKYVISVLQDYNAQFDVGNSVYLFDLDDHKTSVKDLSQTKKSSLKKNLRVYTSYDLSKATLRQVEFGKSHSINPRNTSKMGYGINLSFSVRKLGDRFQFSTGFQFDKFNAEFEIEPIRSYGDNVSINQLTFDSKFTYSEIKFVNEIKYYFLESIRFRPYLKGGFLFTSSAGNKNDVFIEDIEVNSLPIYRTKETDGGIRDSGGTQKLIYGVGVDYNLKNGTGIFLEMSKVNKRQVVFQDGSKIIFEPWFLLFGASFNLD